MMHEIVEALLPAPEDEEDTVPPEVAVDEVADLDVEVDDADGETALKDDFTEDAAELYEEPMADALDVNDDRIDDEDENTDELTTEAAKEDEAILLNDDWTEETADANDDCNDEAVEKLAELTEAIAEEDENAEDTGQI
ncbi:MAG: hypothetical protein PHZ00_05585 [Candidatus Peribacteraceae bacterium]|nr:hypothetical protein [Candidatus Peribacteraceae bacterium]